MTAATQTAGIHHTTDIITLTAQWVYSALQQLQKSLCSHARIAPNEGKCFCPDCGDAQVYQWEVLMCEGCNTRRPSHLLWGTTHASSACCLNCGETSTSKKYLRNPKAYQLNLAQLACYSPHRYETEVLGISDHQTRWKRSLQPSAWIEWGTRQMQTQAIRNVYSQ